MSKILFIILISYSTLLFSQTNQVSDSTRKAVAKRIQKTNELLIQKGYKWRASVTSMSYLTEEEKKHLCGGSAEVNKWEDDSLAQLEMYNKYLKEMIPGLSKTSTIPDWKSLMNTPVVQNLDCNCWAYATTAVMEGLW